MKIDFVYIIHLDRAPKRKVHMEKVMKEQNIKNYKYIGFDGSKIPESTLKEINNRRKKMYDSQNVKDCKNMTRGQIGCIKSHCLIYEEIIQNKFKNVLILEDDVKFNLDFIKIEEMFSQFPCGEHYDYILLHRKCQNLCNIARSWPFVKTWFKSPNIDEELGFNENYIKSGSCFGTCSQIVSASGANKLHKWFSTIWEPMDLQLHMCNSHNNKFNELCNDMIVKVYATKNALLQPVGFPSLTQNIR